MATSAAELNTTDGQAFSSTEQSKIPFQAIINQETALRHMPEHVLTVSEDEQAFATQLLSNPLLAVSPDDFHDMQTIPLHEQLQLTHGWA